MDVMAKTPEKLTDKLKLLCECDTQQHIADVMGVSLSQIKQYLKGATPGPLQLLRLAQYKNTDVGWLIDDKLAIGDSRHPGSTLTGDQLVTALWEAMKSNTLKIHDLLDQVDVFDWESVGLRIEAMEGKHAPRDIQLALELFESILMAQRFAVRALTTESYSALSKLKGFEGFTREVDHRAKHDDCIVRPLDKRIGNIHNRLGKGEKVKALQWAMFGRNHIAWVDPDAAIMKLEDDLERLKFHVEQLDRGNVNN